MMTCSPLSAPEGLTILIRKGISKLCPTRRFDFSWHLESHVPRASTSW